jgi:hypothetical protein
MDIIHVGIFLPSCLGVLRWWHISSTCLCLLFYNTDTLASYFTAPRSKQHGQPATNQEKAAHGRWVAENSILCHRRCVACAREKYCTTGEQAANL